MNKKSKISDIGGSLASLNTQDGSILQLIFSYFTIFEIPICRLSSIWFNYIITKLTPLKFQGHLERFKKRLPPLTQYNFSYVCIGRGYQLEQVYENTFENLTLLKTLKIKVPFNFSKLFGITKLEGSNTLNKLCLNVSKVYTFEWLKKFLENTKSIRILGFYSLQAEAFDTLKSLQQIEEILTMRMYKRVKFKDCKLTKSGIELIKCIKTICFQLSNSILNNAKGWFILNCLLKNDNIKHLLFKDATFSPHMILIMIKRYRLEKPQVEVFLDDIMLKNEFGFPSEMPVSCAKEIIEEYKKGPKNVFMRLKYDCNVVSFNDTVEFMFLGTLPPSQ